MIHHIIDLVLLAIIAYQWHRLGILRASLGVLLRYTKERDDISEEDMINKVIQGNIDSVIEDVINDD